MGVSYAKVVRDREYWRCLTASSRTSPLCTCCSTCQAFGASGWWSRRGRGEGWGSGWYVRYTLVMLVGTMALVILSYHVLVRMGHERYERVTAVGYSCVVFGWMTVLSVRQPTSSLSLLGYVQLPVNLAPFGSPIFTSVVVPQASFVGTSRNSRGIRGGVGRVRVDELVVDRGAGARDGDGGRDEPGRDDGPDRLSGGALAPVDAHRDDARGAGGDRAGRSRGSDGSSEGEHRTPRTPTCENGTAMQSTSSPDTGYH